MWPLSPWKVPLFLVSVWQIGRSVPSSEQKGLIARERLTRLSINPRPFCWRLPGISTLLVGLKYLLCLLKMIYRLLWYDCEKKKKGNCNPLTNFQLDFHAWATTILICRLSMDSVCFSRSQFVCTPRGLVTWLTCSMYIGQGSDHLDRCGH